jgi:plastocyanin
VKRGTLASLMVAACAMAATATGGDVTIELRDATGKPVPDAVIYALPSKGAAPPAAAQARARVDQVNKEFVPRVNIIQAGTEIHFPTSDNIRHSLYSFSPAKTFTTKLYSGREAAPVLFDKTGVVVLGCNIHDKMVAWIFVVDTPWFGKSGADGVSQLKDLPPGKYRVTAAAPAINLEPHSVDVTVEATAARRTITLAGS